MSPDSDDPGARPESGDPHHWAKRLTWALLALALLPFLVGAVVLAIVGNDFHPIQDIAQMELRTRDVGRYEVLLGPYSRDEWYHPGPAVFYLLALPYRLAGGASVGLYVGALVVNAGSVAGMALIARRRGGTALMVITLLASGLLVRSLGAEFVRDPWNPSITVLPFGLMLFLTWAMTCRELWALPVGVVLASFLTQTHVGYAALAVPLLAWGAAWVVAPTARALWSAWRSREESQEIGERPSEEDRDVGERGSDENGGVGRRASEGSRDTGDGASEGSGRNESRSRAWGGRVVRLFDELRGDSRPVSRVVLVSAGLLALLWLPPIIDQLANAEDGNLSAVVSYFRNGGQPAHSLADGWRVLSTQFDLTPGWITGATSAPLSYEPTALYDSLAIPLLLVPLGLAATFLWRRGGEDARRLLLTLAVGFLLGIVAVARTTGIAYTYRLQWVQVLGMATGVVMAWAAWLAIQPHLTLQAARRWVAGAAVAALVGVTAANAVSAARAGTPLEEQSDTVSALVPDILARLPVNGNGAGDGDTGPVLVSAGSFGALLYRTGLVLALERAGVDARISGFQPAAGKHRLLGDAQPEATLIVAVDDEVRSYTNDPQYELLTAWGTPPAPRSKDDPVTLAEQAFAAGDTQLIKELAREHLGEDLPDLFEVHAIAVFLDRGPT